jgi:hypothetical protein
MNTTHPSRLLKLLRRLCAFFEFASVILGCLILVEGFIVVPFNASTPGQKASESIYEFQFDLVPPTGHLLSTGNGGDAVRISNLRGTVAVDQAAMPSPLLSFVRWHAASLALNAALAALIFGLLRRLFENVKAGEVFSAKSVRQIRQIGWSLLGYALIRMGVGSVLDYYISTYLAAHVELHGITTSFLSPPSGDFDANVLFGHVHFRLSLNCVFWGLCMFALAEVFRQGLLLREENELTV